MSDEKIVAAKTDNMGPIDFYWPQARDSSITPVAVQLFQIAAKYDGGDFEASKAKIDAEYALLRGTDSERHGGKFQTAVAAYREMGWISIANGKMIVTPAGRQALALLSETPDFLRAVPYFLVDLLRKFQLNNPERPPARDLDTADRLASSDVFPYWTIWKVMRECDNRITIEELQRFVFKIHELKDVETAINSIRSFRRDLTEGLGEEQLDAKYGARLAGANGEPKYWMGRAGAQIGTAPSLIEKPDSHTYAFNRYYLPLIDHVLEDEPVFMDDFSPEMWSAHFGQSVDVATVLEPSHMQGDGEMAPLALDIGVDDELAAEVERLVAQGSRSFLLTGPPGTSKSWYARQLAARLVSGNRDRVRFVQFHPSYGYEDFIEGFVPEILPGQSLPSFVRQWKVFAEVCDLARGDDLAVLIIDEFSRGDAGRIFGEALTYMEADYRGQPFRLASGRNFVVPNNLVIIATMNPNDRSVAAVDVAMQRRFDVIRMLPNADILRGLLEQNGVDAGFQNRVLDFFTACQEVMPHGGLGHAYFLGVRDEETMSSLWKYKLAPLFDQELMFVPDDLERVRQAYGTLMAD